ncbi:MAG: hypothetical protein V3S30_00345 [Thermoanaerobaculia bacterium]
MGEPVEYYIELAALIQIERLNAHSLGLEVHFIRPYPEGQIKSLQNFFEADRPAQVSAERETDHTGDFWHFSALKLEATIDYS